MGCYVTPQGVPKDACIISEKYRQASTFYLFNHVDITIYYHFGKGNFFDEISFSKTNFVGMYNVDL